MRILAVTNACPPRFVGGAELMVHEQAKTLALLGHEVRVFAGDLGGGGFRHERVDDLYEGVPYHRITTVSEDYSPEFLNFLHPVVEEHFRNVLSEFRPDVVHCHNLIGLSVKLPMLARQHNAAVLCTLHDFWGFCLRNTAIRADGLPCQNISECRLCLPRLHDGQMLDIPLRYRRDFITLALDGIDRFIAPSRFIADRYMLAGIADRIAVIPNGVDTARFRPTNQNGLHPVRITYAGYFGTHKGVLTLLDALALLPGRNVELQLVGEGPEEAAYRARASLLGISEQVSFTGKVQQVDMPKVYEQSDIVVLPSTWDENQPVCLMEGMAAGLPVVASRRGGIPELIDPGVNGFMFTSGDAADLSVQLDRLAGDRLLRQAFGREGRRRAEHLSQARQADCLVNAYNDARRSSRPVRDRRIFAVLGSPHDSSPGKTHSLQDSAKSDPLLVPRSWVTDVLPMFQGLALTGKPQKIARAFGIRKEFTLSRSSYRVIDAFLRLIFKS